MVQRLMNKSQIMKRLRTNRLVRKYLNLTIETPLLNTITKSMTMVVLKKWPPKMMIFLEICLKRETMNLRGRVYQTLVVMP
jgi:hypothetical protein